MLLSKMLIYPTIPRLALTVRKDLADSPVCDVCRYYKALCDVTFHEIEGNGRKVHLSFS